MLRPRVLLYTGLLAALCVAMLASLIAPDHYPGLGYHLLSGGLILGAFFIATDPVSSPNSSSGQLLFGFACGLLTWLIRTWGGYPEGVAFAVMLRFTSSSSASIT